MRYTVIFEKGERGWGAYIPDFPGCVAGGETKAEVEQLIREAIELHIQDMKQRGEAIPQPHSEAGEISIPA